MADVVTITHKITANAVETTVEMSGHAPITKSWNRKPGGGMIGNTAIWWDEEDDIPEEIADAADRAPTHICSLLEP